MEKKVTTGEDIFLQQSLKERVTNFTTDSGIPVKGVYKPEDIKEMEYERDLNDPEQYPFTRGYHHDMYRGRLWSMRLISGAETPERQNDRFRYLVSQGGNALDVVADASTMYGIEPDQPGAAPYVGHSGCPTNCIEDVDIMMKGIPLDKINICIQSLSFPPPLMAYILIAQERCCDLKELPMVAGIAQYHCPPIIPSLKFSICHKGHFSTLGRLTNDFAEYVLRNLPKWTFWYMDSADYTDAGANAILEGALLISCTKELIREMLKRNIDINVVAPRISPNISAGRDFFEDIAKIRAIRRIWARMMKEEFSAGPKGMAMRFYARGIGSYMEGRQPLVNIARGTLTTLIGVLSGASGIQTCSYDEAWCPPTEEAAKLALRTQQVIRYESGIPRVADPLGGSYYVEWLTNKIEEEILATVDRIEQMGGWLAAIEKDWIRSQLRQGAIERQRKVESGERARVGVNCFAEEEETEIRVPDIRDEVTKYISRYKRFKERRDMQKVKKALEDLSRAAEIEGVDLVPYTFEAVKAHATFAEIVGVLRMKDGLDYDLLGERSYPFS